MKEKVLMIILDGFSSNYLREELCPHLYNIAKDQYFSRLEHMFGFQGVGAAIFSGAPSNVTGVFTEFVLQRNEVVLGSRLLQSLMRLTDIVRDETLCIDIRYLMFRMLRKQRPGITNIIPSQLLGYFSPKLTKNFTEENCLDGIPTIFDILRLNNMMFEFQRPALKSENAAISNIAFRIKKRKMPHLLVTHPCSLDLAGHKFGPSSSQVQHAVERMDRLMYKIIRSVRSSSEKMVIMILSDHGMNPVSYNLNLLRILDRLPLKMGNDYLVFLDSTMARFWFFSERATKLIVKALLTLNCGKILEKDDLKKLGIDNVGREYGHLIFAMKEGHTVFPDFFRKFHPPKGMHGYAFPSYDAPILMIYNLGLGIEFKRKEVVRYVDIMPTILELFDLPIPKTCEGASLLS